MEVEDIAHKQLEQFYIGIESSLAEKLTIEKWCITVWLALLAIIASGKFVPSIEQKIFLLFIPILFFWFLEALVQTYLIIYIKRAQELENLILNNQVKSSLKIHHFYLNSTNKMTYYQKIKLFLIAFFTLESTLSFYLLLIFISVFFMLVVL